MSAAIQDLALLFPSLRHAPGLRPWDPFRLDRWAATGVSHGERVSARFVLSVWSAEQEWTCGRFDLMEALAVWDPAHRAAFILWAQEPWWP